MPACPLYSAQHLHHLKVLLLPACAVPVLLGDGIPLFGKGKLAVGDLKWSVVGSPRVAANGLVQTTYRRARA